MTNKDDKTLGMTSVSKGKRRVCVITSTFGEGVGQVLLSKFLKVLEPICEKLNVITGTFENEIVSKKISITRLNTHEDRRTSLKILKFIVSQVKVCWHLLKVRKDIDVVMFYINSGSLTLSIMLAKILKKKVVLIVSASDSEMASIIYRDYLFGIGGRVVVPIYRALEKINRVFSDRIIVDSEKIARDYVSGNYRHKVVVASDRRFIDADAFTVKRKLEERRNLVGYIGRLSYEKGVMNLVKAIPLVLKKRSDLEFLIGGDGPLLIKLQEEITKAGLDNKVNFVGWIPNDELANWLNELKLLVLPSYTEGLPNIVLEAMACGTPVLVTPVGALPDIIRDKETGFIMKDNTPNCIAENIITALQYPKLDEIVTKARQLVAEKYTYETAVGRYKEILNSLGQLKKKD